VRGYILLTVRPIDACLIFTLVPMDNSSLSLVILNGFVYPVRKDEVEDLIENFSD
jgi:hypothetical protein